MQRGLSLGTQYQLQATTVTSVVDNQMPIMTFGSNAKEEGLEVSLDDLAGIRR